MHVRLFWDKFGNCQFDKFIWGLGFKYEENAAEKAVFPSQLFKWTNWHVCDFLGQIWGLAVADTGQLLLTSVFLVQPSALHVLLAVLLLLMHKWPKYIFKQGGRNQVKSRQATLTE